MGLNPGVKKVKIEPIKVRLMEEENFFGTIRAKSVELSIELGGGGVKSSGCSGEVQLKGQIKTSFLFSKGARNVFKEGLNRS